MPPKPPRRTRERILETALAMFNQFGEPTVATDGERNREILLGSAERAEALTRPISRTPYFHAQVLGRESADAMQKLDAEQVREEADG